MSTALSLEVLFAPETSLYDGLILLLEEARITAHRQRGTDDLAGERCEIHFESGGNTEHYGQDKSGRWWLDSWNGTLTFRVVTKRGNAVAHESMLARVRIRMQIAAGFLANEAVFPHHVVTIAQESSAPEFVEPEEDYDVTELRFDVVVSIRTDAWPA